METTAKSTKFAKDSYSVTRRKRALKRLENQLLTGYKTVFDRETGQIGSEKLSDKDRKRIEKEIETLKTRI